MNIATWSSQKSTRGSVFSRTLILFFLIGSGLVSALPKSDLEKGSFIQAQQGIPSEMQSAQVSEKIAADLKNLGAFFRNEKNEVVTFDSLLNRNKPIILSLVYYNCPHLCTFVLNGMVDGLKSVALEPGKDFEILSLSIDPTETPALAVKKKQSYLQELNRKGAEEAWHFWTGSEESVRKIAGSVGFGYYYDEKEKQYAHSSALIFITPQGRVARYLYGIEFPKKDLSLALVEASQGKIGGLWNRFVLFCYHYNPKTKKYSLLASRLMQVGGSGTVMIFGAYMLVFWRRQRKTVKGA